LDEDPVALAEERGVGEVPEITDPSFGKFKFLFQERCRKGG